MIFNDGSEFRVLTDPGAYRRSGRDLYMYRATVGWASNQRVDNQFSHHRQVSSSLVSVMYAYVHGQAGTPEQQADLFVRTIGQLGRREMVMLDIETAGGISNPADFTRRWLSVVESRLNTRAWVYTPMALSSALAGVTGGRVIMAPRYSGTANRGAAPSWRWDIHQYTDRGPFPGCSQSGDTSFSSYTTEQLVVRSRVFRSSSTMLQVGSTGNAVSQLQSELNAWYPTLAQLQVDGDFGPATKARVTYFQGNAHLEADGVAGPQTLSALGLS